MQNPMPASGMACHPANLHISSPVAPRLPGPSPASSGAGAGPLREGRLRLRRGPLMCRPEDAGAAGGAGAAAGASAAAPWRTCKLPCWAKRCRRQQPGVLGVKVAAQLPYANLFEVWCWVHTVSTSTSEWVSEPSMGAFRRSWCDSARTSGDLPRRKVQT